MGRPSKNSGKASTPPPVTNAVARLHVPFVPPPGRGDQGCSLEKELDKLREKLSGAKDVAGAIQLLGETINHLQTLAGCKVEQQFREQEDDLDDMRQRSMKGNLLLSSTKEHEAQMFPKEEVLEAKGENVMDLARSLVKRKFKVDIPEEDLGTVHYLPKGIILRQGSYKCRGVKYSANHQILRLNNIPISNSIYCHRLFNFLPWCYF